MFVMVLFGVGCASTEPMVPREPFAPQASLRLLPDLPLPPLPSPTVVTAFLPDVPPMVESPLSESLVPAEETPKVPEAPKPQTKKPGTTLIVGDSTMAIFDQTANPINYQALHESLDIDGKVLTLAKGETRANWVQVGLMLRPAGQWYTSVQNVVISTGSNNLGSHDTADDIWKSLTAIYADFAGRGIRVYACTLPPGKGIPNGLWAMNYPAVKAKRDELNERIRDALHTGDVYHVIDLAAPLSKGGLANDSDIERLDSSISRFPGDPAHASGEKMAEIIHRELLIGTNKAPPGPYPGE